jgi:hypothetical protein
LFSQYSLEQDFELKAITGKFNDGFELPFVQTIFETYSQVKTYLHSNNLRINSIKPKYNKTDQFSWWVRLDEDCAYSVRQIKERLLLMMNSLRSDASAKGILIQHIHLR